MHVSQKFGAIKKGGKIVAVEKEKLSGMRLSFQYGTPPAELTQREIKREPTIRAKK